MDLIKMARDMGKAIQESDEYKKIEAVKLANDDDQELQKQIEEFNNIRNELSGLTQEENRDEAKMKNLDASLKDMYTKIMGNANMMAFNEAKQDIDNLMNGITTILMSSVNGEDPDTCEAHPSSCGGSCGSCGGCH